VRPRSAAAAGYLAADAERPAETAELVVAPGHPLVLLPPSRLERRRARSLAGRSRQRSHPAAAAERGPHYASFYAERRLSGPPLRHPGLSARPRRRLQAQHATGVISDLGRPSRVGRRKAT